METPKELFKKLASRIEWMYQRGRLSVYACYQALLAVEGDVDAAMATLDADRMLTKPQYQICPDNEEELQPGAHLPPVLTASWLPSIT